MTCGGCVCTGEIVRIPGTHRWEVTDFGLRVALLFTQLHNRFIRPGLAQNLWA